MSFAAISKSWWSKNRKRSDSGPVDEGEASESGQQRGRDVGRVLTFAEDFVCDGLVTHIQPDKVRPIQDVVAFVIEDHSGATPQLSPLEC